MTDTDRAAVREILTDVIGAHSAKANGKFDIIQVQLSAIREQTEKTNGRVTALESETKKLHSENLIHVVKCPNTKKIEELEHTNISRKGGWKFAAKLGTITGIIVSLIYGLIEILIKT